MKVNYALNEHPTLDVVVHLRQNKARDHIIGERWFAFSIDRIQKLSTSIQEKEEFNARF